MRWYDYGSSVIRPFLLLLALVAGSLLFLDGQREHRPVQSPPPPWPPFPTEPVVPLRSLRQVPVPEPPNLNEFVRSRAAAIALGKALFWDMQVGSDGVQACATCHFHAGTDNRTKNQLSPALGRVDVNWNPLPGTTFAQGGPNHELTAADFPVRSDNVVSSQGIHRARFERTVPGSPTDVVSVLPDPVFHIRGVNVRQVPHRATPTVINAVFNHRQFWDGRAQNEFNGTSLWGDRDPRARVARVTVSSGGDDDDDDDDDDDGGSRVELVRIRLTNASLASQAVGPVTSSVESSADGRDFIDIASKLFPVGRGDEDEGERVLTLRPLARQVVARDDSVLGLLSRSPQPGLQYANYGDAIRLAFHDRWWKSSKRIAVDSSGRATVVSSDDDDDGPSRHTYSVMEYNFALFFGLAVQMYEATLVSNQTPFDAYMEGNTAALTPQQVRGLAVFNSNTGRCVNCHGGGEFTNAGVTSVAAKRLFRRSGDFVSNLLDTGFNNIGVRPTREDLGVGGGDPWGKPLSLARQTKLGLFADPRLSPPYTPGVDVPAVDGAFKTPGLRNIELTGPFFHNGGYLTLRQVVDFYDRGGDFRLPVDMDSRDGLTAPLRVLNLAESDKDALVAFLLALTDERVRHQRAPFDHPELLVPNGHPGTTSSVTNDGTNRATDTLVRIPAVGRNGGAALRGFLQ